MVTALSNIPALQNILEGNSGKSNRILAELLKLMRLSKYSKATTTRLRSTVKAQCFKNGQFSRNFNNDRQHDAAEFMLSLIEHMFMDTPDNMPEKIFGGLLQETIKCECGKTDLLPVKSLSEIIPLQMCGQNIEACFEDFLAPEDIDRTCSICKNKLTMKENSLMLEPATLILQLKRYSFNLETNESNKIHDRIICPKIFRLKKGSLYRLSSIINHIGENPQQGHYNVILFDQTNNVLSLVDDIEVSHDIQMTPDLQELPYIVTYVKV